MKSSHYMKRAGPLGLFDTGTVVQIHYGTQVENFTISLLKIKVIL